MHQSPPYIHTQTRIIHNCSPISAWNLSNEYLHPHHDRVIEHRRPSQQQQKLHQQQISIQSNRWQIARAAKYQLKD